MNGLEGEIYEFSVYNGRKFARIRATNDGPKYDKAHLAWRKGNKTYRLKEEIELIDN